MKLNTLLSNIKNQVISINPCNFSNIDIKGLSLNSKLVKKGYLFFCLAGSRYNGLDFINEAYSNGAHAVMVEDNIKIKLPKDSVVISVKDITGCLGFLANKFYDYPIDRLNMTAVTGTNGKTTITFMIENILNTASKQAGVIGTINYRFGRSVFDAKNTTPDILTIHSFMNQMLQNKIKYLVMEVSSHALAQRRIEGLKFDQAIFTNLSQDHFDYHKTKKNYFAAKSLLFTDYLKKEGAAIINVDDSYGLKLIDLIKKNKKSKILTYGIRKKSDVCAKNILLTQGGCRFTVKAPGHKFEVKTRLIGQFNIYNALASISACLALGILEKYIIKGLEEVYAPGRLERVDCSDINIFVDYAHTEDALRNVLSSLNKLKGRGRLILVFGCGGDRDKDKRPKMGKVASELADFVIITSDNPRSEDPEEIISDIKAGISKTNHIASVDRKEAIKKAIDMAGSQDIIIVAGKGHEDYQIVKDKKFNFSDRAVIENILSQRG
ncbi:MAG: UDP-N-acetylmuramoyl-L-alanyl-D-glutamate--2,6-diaminopimelate ligase [Candidatus Omnitrophica bacterium]|nr:UDP-N-acetylmuramoyl-L-alanyl-D-glutamate--2,6-diaminopimelate ligase [Candidatus Omnitrophota bacterium]MDD5352797.1 UDP-N-acetylmuramoyl-L-alanyl-D-glutamate--2,6-diaminopimelate ligase [Candidatus Omnitrophota bacterium]MDD5550396.1 UDP-N-acetylmuramoyl-L-alanyl-D-glutamate--2,6-diaminopimelate ligase [Candidatus Omnitrophota bacterium]